MPCPYEWVGALLRSAAAGCAGTVGALLCERPHHRLGGHIGPPLRMGAAAEVVEEAQGDAGAAQGRVGAQAAVVVAPAGLHEMVASRKFPTARTLFRRVAAIPTFYALKPITDEPTNRLIERVPVADVELIGMRQHGDSTSSPDRGDCIRRGELHLLDRRRSPGPEVAVEGFLN